MKSSLAVTTSGSHCRSISTTPLSNLSVLLSSYLRILSLFIFASIAYAQKPTFLIAAASDLFLLGGDLDGALAKSLAIEAKFSFESSGALASQIENGAPFDVFLSANEDFVNRLAASRRLIPESVVVYGCGRLGLWSKSGKIKSLADLLAPGVEHLSIANPAHAPYGAAAEEMLKRRGLWQRVQPKVVYGENVQQAYQFAQTGNAEACIAAWSLMRESGGIALPLSDYSPIQQAGGVVSSSNRKAEAKRLLDFLTSAGGKKLLQKYGFGTP
jgi:molybdate transport system substrate-binding protein